jgi:glycolate oxidase
MGSRLDAMLIALSAALPSDAISTELEDRQACAGDESEVPPVVPDAIVRARSAGDVAHTLRVASEHGVPVTPRAAGTGKSGGCVPVEGGIVLSLAGMRGLDEIDRTDSVAVVQPGLVLGALHEAVEKEGLFYPPDPNSWAECTLGGNIAENAAGPRTYKYGTTRDWVLGLEVVTGDGTKLSLGTRTHKGVTGYDLTSLVVGSEGTLAVVTRATLRLMPRPEAITTLVALLPSHDAIGAATLALAAHGIEARCLELFDARTLDILRASSSAFPISAGARALLLVELDGLSVSIDALTERAGSVLTDAGAEVLVAKHAADRERLWSVRRELSRALRRTARAKLSEDVVVPRSKLGALIEAATAIGERHQLGVASYGHAGDGNLHVNFLWDDPDETAMLRVRPALDALFSEVLAMRGTLSGEHGIGASKRAFVAREQSSDAIAMQQRVRALFDPKGVLNPGKIFAADGHRGC